MYFIMFEDATGFCLKVICSDEFSMLVSRFNVVAGKSDVSGPKNNIKQKKDKKHTHTHTSLYKSAFERKRKKRKNFKGTFNFRSLSIDSKADVSKAPFLLQVLAQKIAFFSKARYLVR